MKTMKEMHDEMLSKARFDGGWPRPVVMGPGIIALARNQEHLEELLRSSRRAHLLGIVGGAACAIVGLILILLGT